MNQYQMSKLYNSIDNFIVDSFSSESHAENPSFFDRSFQTPLGFEEQANLELPSYQNANMFNEKMFLSPKLEPRPLDRATSLSSSNNFTISFGDIKHDDDILTVSDSCGKKKVSTTVRNPIKAKDHVLAERKRREKLNESFVSLSALLPNVTKMDKASVLEDGTNYIKELERRVKELEGLASGFKRKDVQEVFVSVKKSRLGGSDVNVSSREEMNSGESRSRCKFYPEIKVRKSGSSVLVRIHCQKNTSFLVKALREMQKIGLSVISNSVMPSADTTLITIIAQAEEDFSLTATDLVKNLQLIV